MKRLVLAALAVALLASGLLAGCDRVRGSGKLKTESFNFSDFSRVAIGSAFQVEIMQSASYSVSVTADDNVFKYLRVSKEGATLEIGLSSVSLFGPLTLKANITMPVLKGLSISGAARGTVSGFGSRDDLDVKASGASSLSLVGIVAGDADFDVSGASKVSGDVVAHDAVFKVSGASTLQLKGSAGDIAVQADGASHAELLSLPVRDANVRLTGASTCTLNLVGKLDADLSGASKLEYSGQPTLGTLNTSGASTISKK